MTDKDLLKDTQVALEVWDRALTLAIIEMERTYDIEQINYVKQQFIEMAIEDKINNIKY